MVRSEGLENGVEVAQLAPVASRSPIGWAKTYAEAVADVPAFPPSQTGRVTREKKGTRTKKKPTENNKKTRNGLTAVGSLLAYG